VNEVKVPSVLLSNLGLQPQVPVNLR